MTTTLPRRIAAEVNAYRRKRLGAELAAGVTFDAFAELAWPFDVRHDPVNGLVNDALVAVHEAGHAVAAQVLGGRVREAMIFPAWPGRTELDRQGMTSYRDLPEPARGSVLYAGTYAQARWCDGQRPRPHALAAARKRHGGTDDYELSALVSAGHWYRHDANPIIERCWPAVMTVAGKLFATNTANETDVLAALGCDELRRDAKTHRLASLRAGLVSM
jgi:hypothetical protein